MSDKSETSQIKLRNVRLSYPAIFTAKAFEEGQKAKYNCQLILGKDTHAPIIKALQAKIDEAAKSFFGKTVPTLKGVCLRDGSEKGDKDGYGEDVMFVSASSERRPQVVDRDPSIPLVEADGKPYAGCYVNAMISLWVQDNKFGKRVNANILAVQFLKDGEPFGESITNATEAFENEADEGGSEDPLA